VLTTLDKLRLGVIGAGNMATAILDGIIAQKLFSPERVTVSNPHADKLEHPKALGISVTCDNRVVAETADLILLGVKPQKLDEVLDGIADCCAGKGVISIAAGISTDHIRTRLPGALVIRAMPNTPLQLGLGATAVAQAPDVPEGLFQAACEIFAAVGCVSVIPESQMDTVVPVNGSSPAFFFRMVDVMTRWASGQGMDPRAALELCAVTMKGAAEMLLRSGKTADELVRQVCSPGGTTLAALSAFDEHDFDGLLADAMDRCVRRSQELGK
jgi:pyrroline-5-carboxylate reductase